MKPSRLVEPDLPAVGATVATDPQAKVPRLMKFSGTLRDATGKPLSGSVDVTFALYNTEAGGDALWFETQSVQTDDLGRYTALLGAMHTDGLPVELFTSGEVRWLGIQVGAEAEQQPRVLLVSVPYALKAGDAETLGGKPASAYALSDLQNGTASAPAAGATAKPDLKGGNPKPGGPKPETNATVGNQTTNYVTKWSATANQLVNSSIFDNGNVGVGTASPATSLNVVSGGISDIRSQAPTYAKFSFNSSGGSTDQKKWQLYSDSGSNALYLGALNDAENNQTIALQISRGSATAISSVDFPNGNVGIATSVPAFPLDVVSPTYIGMTIRAWDGSNGGSSVGLETAGGTNNTGNLVHNTYFSGTSGIWSVMDPAVGTGIVQLDNVGNLRLYTNTAPGGNYSPSERLRITGTGNVGIGTTSPADKTDIEGAAINGAYTPLLRVGTNDVAYAGSGGGIELSARNNGAVSVPIGVISGYLTNGGIGVQTGDLTLWTSNSGALGERVRITSAGNVGIGTTAPGAQLDVQNSSAQGNIALRAANGNGTTMFIPNSGAGGYNNLVQGGDQAMIFYGTAGNTGNLVIGPWSGTGYPGIRMTTAGNVGIGTSAPAATLEVNGTAKFDNTVTFAGTQTFPGTGTITSVTAGSDLTGGGVAGNVTLNLDTTKVPQLGTANTFAANLTQTIAGNLFVGSGSSLGLPLEVRAAGNDALTVDTSGTVSVGASSVPTHVTTGSANSDFAGQISLSGAGSGSYTFQTAFVTNPPVCVVTPTSSLGTVTWYENVTKTQLTVSLSSGTASVAFNYICVGNPN